MYAQSRGIVIRAGNCEVIFLDYIEYFVLFPIPLFSLNLDDFLGKYHSFVL